MASLTRPRIDHFPAMVSGTIWPPEGTKNYTTYPFAETGPYYAVIPGASTRKQM